MANLKDVPVQELLDELLSRVEAEMIRIQANIEAQEHEKKAVLHELDEVLRRLASSTKEQGRIDRGRAKTTSEETNH
jgi:hypothetical protein